MPKLYAVLASLLIGLTCALTNNNVKAKRKREDPIDQDTKIQLVELKTLFLLNLKTKTPFSI